jgi:hypothetical protein
MSIPYTKFQYFYPPRPGSGNIVYGNDAYRMWLSFEDAIGQFKLNGQRNLIFISPQDEIQLWNRWGQVHQSYEPPEFLLKLIRGLNYPHGRWNVFDSELLHLKLKSSEFPQFQNRIYLYDALVWGGDWLLDVALAQRGTLVKTLTNETLNLKDVTKQPFIFRAENILPKRWEWAWEFGHKYPWIEGLVLKRMGWTSRLEMGTSERNNGGWSQRMRYSDLPKDFWELWNSRRNSRVI